MITLILIVACMIALSKCLWLYYASIRIKTESPDCVLFPESFEPLVKVSLIVPAWNDAGVLERCLNALVREMRTVKMQSELIVIAGGEDASYERALGWKARQADSLDVTVLAQSAHGKNRALNDGVVNAHGQILVLVDADTEVLPGWLPALIEPLVRGQAAATTGCFCPFHKTSVSTVFVIEQYLAQVVGRRGNLFGGGTIALTQEIWSRIGGFPNDVTVGVDWDLTQRVHRRGYVTKFVPSASVMTEIAESWWEFWRAEVRWRRGWWALQRTLKARMMALYTAVTSALMCCSLVLLIGALIGPRDLRYLLALAALTILIWCLGPYIVRIVLYWRHTRTALTKQDVAAYLLAAYVSSLALIAGIFTPGQLAPHFKGQRTRDVA
ncbi:MAG: hypothetical protein C7B45_01325 [Sulfobacillus acidophilus]|uniref:Glycosyltransferase 2-like domain-containing protein n=1 Tax=Sulfobacillus acidophilus TaxID=53633 RepID=A0A2T2WP03_9FIRM|nr:MAG: hypothetical protein C7B45_01325 [Sulfobacillus acidophilus]